MEVQTEESAPKKIWLLTKTAHHSPKLELLIKNREKEYKKKTTKPRLLQDYSKPFLGHSAGMSHRGIRGLQKELWDSTCPACIGSWVQKWPLPARVQNGGM